MEANNNVVQKIQELIAQTKYKEAAELAAKSMELTTKQLEELQTERDIAMKQRENNFNTILELMYDVKFTHFSYSELEKATNNFDKEHVLGEGGYGIVYKGSLGDSHTPVAIKILESGMAQGDKQFNHEVEVLSKIRHPNLVSLIGVNAEKKSLIYELIPNGSLEDYLINVKENLPPLSWENRIHIASGICSALIFLHSVKPRCIVHGDVNPGNVLLDSNFMSKLSDFGMSRVMDQTSAHKTQFHQTKIANGTAPYIAPEYHQDGELTTRSDVFSFGILLLQLFTGRRLRGLRRDIERAADKGKLDVIIDGLPVEWPKKKTKKLLLLGLKCSSMEKTKRPDLEKDVWSVIESMKLACGHTSFWPKWMKI